jgi:hypothetical protein
MWRLLEVGEKRERGDEIFSMSSGDGWFECSNLAIGSTVRKDHAPCRRRVPDPCAEIGAAKSAPLVKLRDRVTVTSGTWSGCTGKVYAIDHKRGMLTRVGLTLECVFSGGRPYSVWESADNVTVLVEPVAVDPEWRLLSVGETIRYGDECWSFGVGPWLPSLCVGDVFERCYTDVRRRVRIESPGWRYLDAGETVQAGDDVIRENGICVPLKATGIDSGWIVQDYGRFCRKTAPFGG